jgi:hypothetical protein
LASNIFYSIFCQKPKVQSNYYFDEICWKKLHSADVWMLTTTGILGYSMLNLCYTLESYSSRLITGIIMQRQTKVRMFLLGAALFMAVQATTVRALAIIPGTENVFRDTRGANNLAGVTPGDRIQFGGDIAGGSGGARIELQGAGAFSPRLCAPLTVAPNFCSATVAYSPSYASANLGVSFTRAGELGAFAPLPTLIGTESAVPFPVNVSISGAGNTPTISWAVPQSFSPDALRVVVYDRSVLRENGSTDIVHSAPVVAGDNSYQIPATLSSGQTLQMGGDYVFALQLIDTRGDPATFIANNNNAEILRRSTSYFNFTPLGAGEVPAAFLPTIVNGIYNFNITNIGPETVTYIDPVVAVGYDYKTGDGNPNFASVLLPTGIGDNLFDLFFWDGASWYDSGVDLVGGTRFFFLTGGVNQFSVRGIETGAALDPNDSTAFITGLTWVSNGNFTGTMTPITVDVPEVVPVPHAAALLLFGIFLLRPRSVKATN